MSSCWRIDSISTVISWVVVASGAVVPNTHALRLRPPSQLATVLFGPIAGKSAAQRSSGSRSAAAVSGRPAGRLLVTIYI
jgi:hypothetical protein